jgi:nucleotidyltransferase substrate binding protein (TIGR01987 family)
MEKLTRKRKQIIAALKSLEISIHEFNELNTIDRYHEIVRDSVIKRFEYSIDIFWKLLKEYLEEKLGMMPPAAPKGVFKAAVDAQIISIEEEIELRLLIENRNLTSHTYNIDLAEAVAQLVPKHYKIMQAIAIRLNS